MKRLWAIGLGSFLLSQGTGIQAEELQWRSAAPRIEAAVPPSPQVLLGRPVPLREAPAVAAPSRDPEVKAASFSTDVLGTPIVVRAQAPDLPPPPPPPPPIGASGAPGGPDDRYNCGVVAPPPAAPGPILAGTKNLWDCIWKGGSCSGPAGGRASLFQSDHCFDNFVSPVTNPFLFEDPRALTEVKPLFMYQLTPDKNYIFKGGDIEYYGLQARLAIGPRFDIVVSELGFIAMQIDDGPQYPDSSSLSQITIGPKFTFLRNDPTKTVAAIGMNFQLPVGSAKVFQDTGSLSVIPYLSVAQAFGKSNFGCFNFMGNLGYSFSSDNQRAEYLYTNLHLDYNIANRLFPLIELDWIHYTSDGHARNLGFEGGDLANLGSTGVGGDDDGITFAIGARYKFSECIQSGFAAQFPLEGRRDLFQFRLTFDLIFRY